jgi:hypothetical protein
LGFRGQKKMQEYEWVEVVRFCPAAPVTDDCRNSPPASTGNARGGTTPKMDGGALSQADRATAVLSQVRARNVPVAWEVGGSGVVNSGGSGAVVGWKWWLNGVRATAVA